MLKEAIEKLVSLKDNKIYEIDGRTYSDNQLARIDPPVYRPDCQPVNSLDGIVKMVQTEIGRINAPIFVNVADYNHVKVYTTYDNDLMFRDNVYEAISDTPRFAPGWMEHEAAVIFFRSRFAPSDDVDYVLKLISRISEESSVKTEDNGITQTVEARSGIAMMETVEVRPIVNLRPYRTFMEVEQPASDFLLRLGEGGSVGLFEADGGMWRLEAKRTIESYFTQNLGPLIESGKVVVTI